MSSMGFLGCVGVSQPDPTGELPVTPAKPPARYGAIGGAGGTLCDGEIQGRLAFRAAVALSCPFCL